MDQFLSWLTGLAALVVPGFGGSPPTLWNGYVEADYVYVSSPTPGIIETVAVGEGDTVARGDGLFALQQQQQQALLRAAEARVAAARANVANLATGGREAEVEVIRASLGKAEADLELARTSLDRTEQLTAEGLVPVARRDQDRATLQSAEAQVRQLQAQLQVAELPARDPLQVQAEASLRAAEAEAAKARLDLEDRSIVAPQAGRVDQVFFAAGEMAGAGVPVVALLPEGALKVRFYVSEAERPLLDLGVAVAVRCDSCAPGLTATVSHFAAQPQFTPPIIFSREERARLTFLTEAKLGPGVALPPGQPVSVEPLP